jgi:hypothetical protein
MKQAEENETPLFVHFLRLQKRTNPEDAFTLE